MNVVYQEQFEVLVQKFNGLSERLDAVIDAMDETLLFSNDRLHRVSLPQPADTTRLTKLHTTLRALRAAISPRAA